MTAVPPRRLALVIGNSEYVQAPKLPGSVLDAEKIRGVLKDLGFDVTIATDVTSRGDFVFNYLKPFLAQIKEGDVVVFYFSGHGFSYSGENYIAPLDFTVPVSSDDLLSTFVSTTGVEIQITERRPALVLIMLDACRSIPNLKVLTNGQDDGQVAKGPAEPRPVSTDTIYWFSSALGAVSIGSAEKKVSVYTEALAANIPVDARELDDVKREVRVLVKFKTHAKQVPWSSDSSSAQVYLKPSPDILAKQKELWKYALDEGTQLSVQRFAEIYGTGPYGADARRWLKENPDAPDMKASRVSPAAAEAAWSIGNGGAILLPQVNGSLAPAATVTAPPIEMAASVVAEAEDRIDFQKNGRFSFPVDRLPGSAYGSGRRTNSARREAQAVANARTYGGAAASAQSLGRLGGALTSRSIEARSRPTTTAPVAEVLEPETSLVIEGVTVDAQNRQWLRARNASHGSSFYVEQKAADALPLNVGQTLVELALTPPATGLKSVVDTAPLVEALNSLKTGHKEVTWVSVATPKPRKPGQDALYGLQALFVRAALAKTGIPRDRVTTSEGASENEGVRVRIFGKDN